MAKRSAKYNWRTNDRRSDWRVCRLCGYTTKQQGRRQWGNAECDNHAYVQMRPNFRPSTLVANKEAAHKLAVKRLLEAKPPRWKYRFSEKRKQNGKLVRRLTWEEREGR